MPKHGPPIERLHPGDQVSRLPTYVVEATAKVDKNQNPFARYQLRDRTGVITAIRFRHTLANGEQGSVALVTGQVGEYNGSLQLTVQEMDCYDRDGVPQDIIERLSTPPDPEQRRQLMGILRTAHTSMAPVLWSVFREALGHDPFDASGPFWTYAAARSKHHPDPGGLAWHVLTMLAHVDAIAGHYPGLDVDLLRLAVLCHDLGKIDSYRMSLFGAEQLPCDRTVGHTSYSMLRVMRAIETLRARGLDVTRGDEENLLHAIAAHHGRHDWGAPVEPATPEAHALHALDLLDARLRGGLDERREPPPDRHAPPAEQPVADTDGLAGDNGRTSQPSLF